MANSFEFERKRTDKFPNGRLKPRIKKYGSGSRAEWWVFYVVNGKRVDAALLFGDDARYILREIAEWQEMGLI